ncbi:hypothetical protein Glove_372g52 [Diversispora epigaea]|uniref:Uncharacterized protein n=1 Tax=Diversispora epigaea TaxID=1348612 RepID=A0A397H6N3_9GLOM|nr:hypothetical protein Glove_372g52 [Diversispora epigaea]
MDKVSDNDESFVIFCVTSNRLEAFLLPLCFDLVFIEIDFATSVVVEDVKLVSAIYLSHAKLDFKEKDEVELIKLICVIFTINPKEILTLFVLTLSFTTPSNTTDMEALSKSSSKLSTHTLDGIDYF